MMKRTFSNENKICLKTSGVTEYSFGTFAVKKLLKSGDFSTQSHKVLKKCDYWKKNSLHRVPLDTSIAVSKASPKKIGQRRNVYRQAPQK